MALNFEFFRYDEDDYYAVVSRDNLIFSRDRRIFVSDSSILFSEAALSLSVGGMGRLYGSIPTAALTDGVYVVRIYRGSYASPSIYDEIVSMGTTGWSSITLSQIDPSNLDSISPIISYDSVSTRNYSIKMNGAFVGSVAPEIGLAEMFVYPSKNKSKVSIAVNPRIAGINYNYISIRTNDANRTILQGFSVVDSGGIIESEFVMNNLAIGSILNGNFLLVLSQGPNTALRIGGNPENKITANLAATVSLSAQRTAPSTGISFRTF